MKQDDRVAEILQRVKKTLGVRSHDFLHLSEKTLQQYNELYRKYVTWYIGKGFSGTELSSAGMAHYWAMFLKVLYFFLPY